MLGSGEIFPVKLLTNRARRLFTLPERRGILPDAAPKRKGLIITFCVLASCLLWFTFSMRETYTQFFDFPTKVQNLPDDLALTTLPPPTIRVLVEGEGIQLLRLYYNPPIIPIDAALPEIDLHVVTAEVAMNVRPESVTPASFTVSTDVRREKRIPIRSRVAIVTEPGYQIVGALKLDPDSVTVSGAASLLARLDFWPTAPTRFTAVRDTLRRTVALSDTLVGLVILNVTEMALQADILRFTDGKREIEVRVRNGSECQEFVFDPETTIVSFQVPIVQYDLAMTAEDFYALVTCDEIRTDTTGKVYPIVNPPRGLILREIRIVPDSFRYYETLSGPD